MKSARLLLEVNENFCEKAMNLIKRDNNASEEAEDYLNPKKLEGASLRVYLNINFLNLFS